jgi:NAD(P)-dependent dehydrogenase (short-subunit alcohol dehydrogenase family)
MLTKSKVVVIGGSSGMGLEIARQTLAAGADVVISSRSKERLERAASTLAVPGVSGRIDTYAADIGNREQVKALFALIGELDHLVITAANLVYGPLRALEESDLLAAIRSKLLGPIFAAQECVGRIRRGGSITFITGIAARRPLVGGGVAAALNASLEGLGRALALELAPVRVNMVSPGWTDTPIWDTMRGMTSAAKQERFAAMSARLPVGRIGSTEDIASAALLAMTNTFMTGTVVHVDGGHQLV